MSDYTLTIPASLYNKAKRIAELNAQPVEDMMRARLEEALDERRIDLPEDERTELNALPLLSDDGLWTMARAQMDAAKQARMEALMDRNSKGTITPDEYGELEGLVEQGQRLTLRKAEAMKQLLKRGYSITLDDLKSPDE